MSEEILKAIMELSALIVKQDGGIVRCERNYIIDFLKKYLPNDSIPEYLSLFDSLAGEIRDSDAEFVYSAPSVKDSVKIFTICKKFNYTLNQKQKIIVLIKLYELIILNKRLTLQRMNIINTVAEVFKVSVEEFKAIELFIQSDEKASIDNSSIYSVYLPDTGSNDSSVRYSDTVIRFLYVKSIDIYFIKYYSKLLFYLNGLPVKPYIIYSFAPGSTFKSDNGHSFYYSDICAKFHANVLHDSISFIVKNLSYRFSNGNTAIDDLSFSVNEGNLIGILGASGSGKTTLINLLSGILKPSAGSVEINGIDVSEDSKLLEGITGYVPQDDLLIESLTVFENLYYAACQCFKDKSKKELSAITDKMLENLDLYEKRDLKVGTSLNNIISGGQRKRLNIALELIREPLILFLDEPTSGLSSRDSENLMSLLRDLSLKGRLIFNVIHQPSSEIFKMFDKIIILDQQGSMAYFGNPVDAIVYFKTIDSQVNSIQGECPVCGNVSPELIFDIIERQIVDEFGQYTEQRKISPSEWAQLYRRHRPPDTIPVVAEHPRNILKKPGRLRQFAIALSRDIKTKLSNLQYIALTLTEAPILGLILSFIIRYIANPDSNVYIFAENENIPIYIFMTIIVALFIGLTISAEEIFQDRKILKREKFLHLSRTAYLFSKIIILIFISAIQGALFLVIANPVLGIKGMFFRYWLAYFVTAFSAGMLGLNISSSFNSAITIYIVIPLLIIPMMVLSGAMFPFDKLNRTISKVDKVPFIAELMPTRWTYEALMVSQFKDNAFSQIQYNKQGDTYYTIQKNISNADFNTVFRIPTLMDTLNACKNRFGKNDFENCKNNFILLNNELHTLSAKTNIPLTPALETLSPETFSLPLSDSIAAYLNKSNEYFMNISDQTNRQKDAFYNLNRTLVDQYERKYHNYKLEEIVTKYYERNKLLVYNNAIVQNVDPIYLDSANKGGLAFRTHFFAPSKYFFGKETDTFYFNLILVMTVNIILYVLLYFNVLSSIINFFNKKNIIKTYRFHQ